MLTNITTSDTKKQSQYSDHKEEKTALAGVVQWIELWPKNQGVTGLIPSQGTCLGCGPGPQLGVRRRQPHIDVSFPLFALPFPSL